MTNRVLFFFFLKPSFLLFNPMTQLLHSFSGFKDTRQDLQASLGSSPCPVQHIINFKWSEYSRKILRSKILQLLFNYWHGTMFTLYIIIECIYMSYSDILYFLGPNTIVALQEWAFLRKRGPDRSFIFSPHDSLYNNASPCVGYRWL